MNYLAHSFFSYPHGEILVGNILADLLNGKEIKLLDERYQNGVKLHRVIDSVTDNHALHRQALYILYPSQGKYSPVVMDIYYDYFLSLFWSQFSDQHLDDFCIWVYTELERNFDYIPEGKNEMLKRMIADDFLKSCATKERLKTTFLRLLKRVRFPSNLENAVSDLIANEKKLEAHFLAFFPEALKMIQGENLFDFR